MDEAREALVNTAQNKDRFVQMKANLDAAFQSKELNERDYHILLAKMAGERITTQPQPLGELLTHLDAAMQPGMILGNKFDQEFIKQRADGVLEGAAAGIGFAGLVGVPREIPRDKYGIVDLSGLKPDQMSKVTKLKSTLDNLISAKGHTISID